MLMRFEVTLDTDEATVAEIFEGIEKALQVIALPNGDTFYTSGADLSVALIDDAPNA